MHQEELALHCRLKDGRDSSNREMVAAKGVSLLLEGLWKRLAGQSPQNKQQIIKFNWIWNGEGGERTKYLESSNLCFLPNSRNQASDHRYYSVSMQPPEKILEYFLKAFDNYYNYFLKSFDLREKTTNFYK